MKILENYTYNDKENAFEREPLVVLVRDLTANRMQFLYL